MLCCVECRVGSQSRSATLLFIFRRFPLWLSLLFSHANRTHTTFLTVQILHTLFVCFALCLESLRVLWAIGRRHAYPCPMGIRYSVCNLRFRTLLRLLLLLHQAWLLVIRESQWNPNAVTAQWNPNIIRHLLCEAPLIGTHHSKCESCCIQWRDRVLMRVNSNK